MELRLFVNSDRFFSQEEEEIGSKDGAITFSDLPPYLFSNEQGAEAGKKGKVRLTKMVSNLEKKWILRKYESINQSPMKILGPF